MATPVTKVKTSGGSHKAPTNKVTPATSERTAASTKPSSSSSTNDEQRTQSNLEFPRGDTVPFPYETPYPQQIALMDTLLQCLQQKEQGDLRQEHDNKTSNKKANHRRRAAVMMLESPTGTGKSLSLACSAMAWLRYCEQRDLNASTTSTQNTKQTTATDDWWNAWVPPEEAQMEQDIQSTQSTAQQARNELSQELDLWRSKVYGDHPGEERANQRRENFVRSAVTTAKMAERVGQRKRMKQTKLKHRNSKGTTIPPKQQQQQQQDFCVTDYKSDPEDTTPMGGDPNSDCEEEEGALESNHNVGRATALLDGHRLDGSHRAKGPLSQHTIGQLPPGTGVRKIIYAARTHSQLSQFVGELKRTAWGDTTRVVALGSRQLLCGNAALKKAHPTEASLTEACLDLKQGKKSSGGGVKKRSKDSNSCGCSLLESKDAVSTLGLHLLTTPSDIEDAARLGSASQTCAYYASRKALAAAEVVVLPYSMLLSRSTRQAIGLSLKESLVVVDEAHNLPEALRSLHSSQLSLPVIQAAMQQLTRYTQTYAQRLAGRNLMYLGNLRKLLQAFAKHLKRSPDQATNEMRATGKENNAFGESGNNSKQNRTLQSTAAFIMELKVDNINLFKLLRYMEQSRLSQKLLGFTRSKDENDEEGPNNAAGLSKHVSAMSIVQTFLEKLNLKGQEGKVVTDWSSANNRVQHPTLRYVLLNPASCFDNVLDEAHALALVGGTLAPFGHVAAELLAGDQQKKRDENCNRSLLQLAADADSSFQKKANDAGSSSLSFVSPQFAAFTCDHVVSPGNVFAECLSMGPSQRQKFDFRHQSRMTTTLCQELGEALLQLSKVIPHGLVVFLPSYSYEAHLVRQWQKSELWDKLNRTKKIFREPKSAQHLESTLRMYSKQAATGGDRVEGNNGIDGALLLAVIGGKMSEGINLANDMARGVVVVGLPYPDITDPELKEKMDTMTKHGVGGLSGQAYYQNLCMRAVNQSIGRAIRHANDYAAILLCDYRYSAQANIWSGLPKWLRHASACRATGEQRKPSQSFQSTLLSLEHFFHGEHGSNLLTQEL